MFLKESCKSKDRSIVMKFKTLLASLIYIVIIINLYRVMDAYLNRSFDDEIDNFGLFENFGEEHQWPVKGRYRFIKLVPKSKKDLEPKPLLVNQSDGRNFTFSRSSDFGMGCNSPVFGEHS